MSHLTGFVCYLIPPPSLPPVLNGQYQTMEYQAKLNEKLHDTATRYILFLFVLYIISSCISWYLLQLSVTSFNIIWKKISNFLSDKFTQTPHLHPLKSQICCMWQNFLVDAPLTGICFNIHLTYYWLQDQISN